MYITEDDDGFHCSECSGPDALDTDCFGEVRCAIHSDPCPGCYDGGGLDEDGTYLPFASSQR